LLVPRPTPKLEDLTITINHFKFMHFRRMASYCTLCIP